MDTYEPRRKKSGRARDRQFTRQRRREDFDTIKSEAPSVDISRLKSSDVAQRASILLNDLRWYLLHKPKVGQIVGVVAGVIFLFFVASHIFGGRVFPNVWSFGTDIGSMSQTDAEAALQSAWNNTQISLTVDGTTVMTAFPAEMGLRLDAQKTFEAARGVGMAGMPMGFAITPVVTLDYAAAQTYMLDLTNQVEIAPSNAGYEWQAGQLVGVAGSAGRALDVMLTLQSLQQDPAGVVERNRLDLQMAALPPDTTDPSPFLETARSFASQNVVIQGYDPYRNETVLWTTTPEEQARWLEATSTGLMVREDIFDTFVSSINNTLNPADTTEIRYIETAEARNLVSEAVNNGEAAVTLRIRYQRATYEVTSGDTGYRIARLTGIPYGLIEEQNSGRNMDQLSVGDTIYLPSRDVTMPMLPVATKRIIVNLNNQSLIAFENGAPVFNWSISSGTEQYPTYPGVYQILSHSEVATGGSFELCSSDLSCGQWEMNWFMGVYEVVPGLMNGFHGGVLLPNGNFLGGNTVGAPFTYGCIMSLDSEALMLYDWADEGTVVEIVSSEYAPQSDLARQWLSTGG